MMSSKVCLFLAFLALSSPASAQEGYATYYTQKSCQIEGNSGLLTASGEAYDEKAMTCALRRRDFGKHYLVYGQNRESAVFVRHNDYGPGRGPTKRGVIIDLSPAAFKEVCGSLAVGKCKVNVQEIV